MELLGQSVQQEVEPRVLTAEPTLLTNTLPSSHSRSLLEAEGGGKELESILVPWHFSSVETLLLNSSNFHLLNLEIPSQVCAS